VAPPPQLELKGGLGLSKTTLGITLIGVSTSVPDIGVQVNASFILNSYVWLLRMLSSCDITGVKANLVF
jgi:Ca2+/Na+ antiporter